MVKQGKHVCFVLFSLIGFVSCVVTPTRWMTELAEVTPNFLNLKLNQVMLWASPDAGCNAAESYPLDASLLRFAVTHDYTIQQQLEGGVRVFDIRLKQTKAGEHRIFHGPYLFALSSTIAQQIKVWAAAGNNKGREVVILRIKTDSSYPVAVDDDMLDQWRLVTFANALENGGTLKVLRKRERLDTFYDQTLSSLTTDPANPATRLPTVIIMNYKVGYDCKGAYFSKGACSNYLGFADLAFSYAANFDKTSYSESLKMSSIIREQSRELIHSRASIFFRLLPDGTREDILKMHGMWITFTPNPWHLDVHYEIRSNSERVFDGGKYSFWLQAFMERYSETAQHKDLLAGTAVWTDFAGDQRKYARMLEMMVFYNRRRAMGVPRQPFLPTMLATPMLPIFATLSWSDANPAPAQNGCVLAPGTVLAGGTRRLMQIPSESKDGCDLPESRLANAIGDTLLDGFGSVSAEEALAGKRFIGVYYASASCPFCVAFTEILRLTYQALFDADKNFEVVFVSSDKDEITFNTVFQEKMGNWLAVPFKSNAQDRMFEIYKPKTIPCLVIYDANGNMLTDEGRAGMESANFLTTFPFTKAMSAGPAATTIAKSQEGACFNGTCVKVSVFAVAVLCMLIVLLALFYLSQRLCCDKKDRFVLMSVAPQGDANFHKNPALD
jgi:hypothetical protein